MDERMKHLNTQYPGTGRHRVTRQLRVVAGGAAEPAVGRKDVDVDAATEIQRSAVRLAEVEQRLAEFEETLADAFELLAAQGGGAEYRNRAQVARREAGRARKIAERELRYALNSAARAS